MDKVRKRIHMLCNAHLDPVWQWEWEEGASAAVSTFRAAADLCEEFEGFVFNHNEAILYKWVEEYEPELFERIKRLVAQGKWHISGGWYLQPDCNMPSGESFVRQILHGIKYFKGKFGVRPHTAINFDSFGHSRGLVQIMRKAGFDSYLFMRPERELKGLPQKDIDFIWRGFDGSEIIAHKLGTAYLSKMGNAIGKLDGWIKSHPDNDITLLPWGVGNHGGGPSRKDLQDLSDYMMSERKKENGFDIIHSTPEKYFEDIKRSGKVNGLMVLDDDLNPRFVGCYTSMIRIKQKHRKLENELYMTEKMLSEAALRGLIEYPEKELEQAFEALITSEFHDILPGSSIQPVEEMALRIMDGGLDIASRLKARAFFALGAGQPAAKEGEYPVLIYNPHPYRVRGIFECEFMLADQNYNEEISIPSVYGDGGNTVIPSQLEKEFSNLNLDWRKRIVFEADLEPSSMNRFDCRVEKIIPAGEKQIYNKKEYIKKDYTITDNLIIAGNKELEVKISRKTGLVESLKINGEDIVRGKAFELVVIRDEPDSWKMHTDSFNEEAGRFTLMNIGEASEFAGVTGQLSDNVRVIENGDVRTVIEALFVYEKSAACMRYMIPKNGTELHIELRVQWAEKDKMLKLEVPFKNIGDSSRYVGQTAYGIQELNRDGTESVSQKWAAVIADPEITDMAFTIINDGIYASDYNSRESRLRLSLLRSAAYCAHPVMNRAILPQDRFSPRMEQGERLYNFWLNAGKVSDRMKKIDREALARNEAPFVLSFFPSGRGRRETASPLIILDDEAVQMSAFKKLESTGKETAEDNNKYIIRLFEPTGRSRVTTVTIKGPAGGKDISRTFSLGAFEIKTILFDPYNKCLEETDLLEGI